ncbi:MAG: FN3 associated domain-containing protein [Kiritimatiellia bacterium]
MKLFFRNLPALLVLFPLWLAAQRPQGLGVDFVDAVNLGGDLLAIRNTGGSGNDGQILRSKDKGDSFTLLYTVPVSSDQLYALAVNGNVVVASGTDSVFYRTADASVPTPVWTSLNPPVGTFGDVQDLAVRGNTWIAAGGALLRSGDNGVTWTSQTPAGMDEMHAAAYNSHDSSWVAVGGNGFNGSAWRSVNDGVNWSAITLPANTPTLKAVAADGFGNVVAVGEAGTVLELAAGGGSFSAANLGSLSTPSENLQAVQSSAEGEWFIGGDQRSLFHLDGGGAEQILDGSAHTSPGDTQAILLLDDAVILSGVEAVPAPVISPGSTDSLEPVEVTLTADPDVDGSYFTQDGIDPDDTATLYTAPFTLSGDATVKAVSIKDGVYSAVVSADYNVTIHTLTLQPEGFDIDLTLEPSLTGYTYQLQENEDLTDNAGWADVGAPLSGTGAALNWTHVNPANSMFWRVEITLIPSP